MLTQNTLDTLRRLKLTGISDALERQLAQPDAHDLAFEERLALLVDHEVLHRENRRLARLLKAARLRVPACVEDIDYRHPRGLERSASDNSPVLYRQADNCGQLSPEPNRTGDCHGQHRLFPAPPSELGPMAGTFRSF